MNINNFLSNPIHSQQTDRQTDVPERILYKLCLLYGSTPKYLADLIQPVATIESRHYGKRN